MATGVLDTNDKDAVIGTATLTTESIITLYAFERTGTHGDWRLIIEISPDSGTSWVEAGPTLNKAGCVTLKAAATQARVKVLVAQGGTSTITAHLLAR